MPQNTHQGFTLGIKEARILKDNITGNLAPDLTTRHAA